MSETVRIDKDAHATLAAIARGKHLSLTEALSRAIEALRREVFFEQVNAGYAELREDPEAWDEEERERARWDDTIADGLENEPPYPPVAASKTPARRGRSEKANRRRAR